MNTLYYLVHGFWLDSCFFLSWIGLLAGKQGCIMHFWNSCCWDAAGTAAMCCCLSSSFPNWMVYLLESKDTIHLNPQYSIGFCHYSWSSSSSMHTSKACFIAHVCMDYSFLFPVPDWVFRQLEGTSA